MSFTVKAHEALRDLGIDSTDMLRLIYLPCTAASVDETVPSIFVACVEL